MTRSPHIGSWRHELAAIVANARLWERPAEVIRSLVHCAQRHAGASTAALTVPTQDPRWLRVAVAAGDFAQWGASVSVLAARTGHALVIDDVALDDRAVQIARSAALGPSVVAPAYGNGCLQGGVMIGRPSGAQNFAAADAETRSR